MFSQWPSGFDDQEVPVVQGELDPGATVGVSSGRFAVDFATMAALDPTQPFPHGVMHVEYAFGADTDSVQVDLLDVDGTGADATYSFEDSAEEGGQLQLRLQADLVDVRAGGEREETVLSTRWTAAGAGRADIVVSGGDLGSLQTVVSECWDASLAAVWTDDGSGVVIGDEAACAFAALEPDATEG